VKEHFYTEISISEALDSLLKMKVFFPISDLEYNLSSSQRGFMIGAYSNANKAIALF